MGGGAADPTDTVLGDAERVRTLAELGEVLRTLRRRHARRSNDSELTVRELARRSGYAYGAISEYFGGKSLAPTDRFDVLIRLLGASADEQRALATARDRVQERRRPRRQETATGPVPRELPPDVYGFTGRCAELDQLDELLVAAAGTPGIGLISAVAGTAGVGKTALAVRWAHQVQQEFPDGCLYVDLRGYDPDRPVRPAEALAGFLRSLGVTGTDVPRDEAERAARFRTLVADRRMLVLLDNARDSDQVRLLLPGGAGCVVVVTSRDALTGLVVRHGARRIGLDPLSLDEAVELLGALVGARVTAEPEAAGALAERCVRLPLALRLVAELAGGRPGTSLADLVAELADAQHRLDRLDAAGEPRTASRAVFSWSYRNLDTATARAFRLLGLFPGREFDVPALAALTGTDLPQARRLLDDLTRAHLVQPAGRGRHRMHDLLRAYAVELADEEPVPQRRAALTRLFEQQLHACALAMDLAVPFDRARRPVVPDPGWPVPRWPDAAAAAAWLDLERSNLVAGGVHAAAHGWPDHAALLARLLVRYLDTGAHHHDAEQLYGAVANGAVMHSAAPVDRAHALTSLGIVRWRLGRYQEAADDQEQALDLAADIGDQAERCRALTGLGIVYWQLGRTGRAVECTAQALELYREAGDRIGQARVLGNLGNMHGRLGNLPVSIEHHLQSLELFRAADDPAGMANELASLGAMLEELGRYPEALEHLREGLACARRIGYRESEAQTLANLGIVHQRLGRLDEALAHHHEALDLLRDMGDRAGEGYCLGYMGTTYERLGQLAVALEHHRAALRIAGDLGDDHLTAELLNRLGSALLRGPRPGTALRSFRRALTLSRRTGNRYQQAHAHRGVAEALTARSDQEAARRHRERAAALYEALGVPEAAEVRAELAGRAAIG
jgi:tetratricopeptide (TPR) repeat protein